MKKLGFFTSWNRLQGVINIREFFLKLFPPPDSDPAVQEQQVADSLIVEFSVALVLVALAFIGDIPGGIQGYRHQQSLGTLERKRQKQTDILALEAEAQAEQLAIEREMLIRQQISAAESRLARGCTLAGIKFNGQPRPDLQFQERIRIEVPKTEEGLPLYPPGMAICDDENNTGIVSDSGLYLEHILPSPEALRSLLGETEAEDLEEEGNHSAVEEFKSKLESL